MSESRTERTCCAWVKRQGGVTMKIYEHKGWPDRLVIKPGGKMMFVEFKANGKKPSILQQYMLDYLHKLGCRAEWTSSVLEFKEIYAAL